jgi:hypothetical protein
MPQVNSYLNLLSKSNFDEKLPSNLFKNLLFVGFVVQPLVLNPTSFVAYQVLGLWESQAGTEEFI